SRASKTRVSALMAPPYAVARRVTNAPGWPKSSPDPKNKQHGASADVALPTEHSHDPDRDPRARKRAARKTFRRQGDSRFPARGHPPRQFQGGGRRAHPYPSL